MNAQIDSAFNQFYELITPPGQHVERVLVYVQKISAHMRERAQNATPYSFVRHRLMGSYARATAIREFSDVDVMFEFRSVVESRCSESHSLLIETKDHLERFAGASVRVSGEVVRLDYQDGICLDVLPALRRESRGFLFPDGLGGWRTTDPNAQERYLEEQDAASAIHLLKFIRGLKYWNSMHGGLIRSYHLESMVARLAPLLNRDYAVATCEVFKMLSKSVRILDPAGQQGELSAYLSDVDAGAVASLFRSAAEDALVALEAQSVGQFKKALTTWSAVYGPQFPRDPLMNQKVEN